MAPVLLITKLDENEAEATFHERLPALPKIRPGKVSKKSEPSLLKQVLTTQLDKNRLSKVQPWADYDLGSPSILGPDYYASLIVRYAPTLPEVPEEEENQIWIYRDPLDAI